MQLEQCGAETFGVDIRPSNDDLLHTRTALHDRPVNVGWPRVGILRLASLCLQP